MVQPGQVLERMTIVGGAGFELEALFQSGVGEGEGTPVVLAPPHPRLAGNMDASVLSEIAWALARADHPTLRFNYRGVGASRGTIELPDLYGRTEPLDGEALKPLLQDLAAAVQLLCETCGTPTCAVVGYSVGAAVAARAGIDDDRVAQVVLVAPPVAALPFDFAALAATGMPLAIICGAADRIAPPELVQRAIARRIAISVVEHADHGFVRGLGDLGTRVASLVR